MRSIVYKYEEGVPCFDSIYDLLLWIYVQIPSFEDSKSANPSKLIFRGHKDPTWSLTSTADRDLKTEEQRKQNRLIIARFAELIRSEYPERMLETQLEQEAVAQHYGHECKAKTSLLDFTTDVDIAAYFATKSSSTRLGTVYMCETSAALRDGRFKLVKLPDRFTRPNAQSGLFLKLVEGAGALESESKHLFTRLNFVQHPPESLETLLNDIGDVEPEDEIAHLAAHLAESPAEPLSALISPAEILYNPAAPEQIYYGTRLFQYAGWLTDKADIFMLRDLLTEIVRNCPEGVENFVQWVAITRLDYSLRADENTLRLRSFQSFVELALALASIYAGFRQEPDRLQRFNRQLNPRSVLLIGVPAERAKVLADVLHAILGRPESLILKLDFSNERADLPRQLERLLALMDGAGETLILLRLDRLLQYIGAAPTKAFLQEAVALSAAVVATTDSQRSVASLLEFFDLTSTGPLESMPSHDDPLSKERILEFAAKLNHENSVPKNVVLKEIASLSLSQGRILKLNFIRRMTGYLEGKEFFEIWCGTYKERDENGNPIEIGPAAVNKVLGGPLSAQDYRALAAVTLDENIVGADLAVASSKFVEAMRHKSDKEYESGFAVFELFGGATSFEILLRALRWFATGLLQQPFETE